MMIQEGLLLQFADNFVSENEKLHVLINNAGCMINQRELTEEGIEKNFATNTLGTHVLTKKLIPLLQKVKIKIKTNANSYLTPGRFRGF
jgi:dehydrogenase/reductase SDR family protein 12